MAQLRRSSGAAPAQLTGKCTMRRNKQYSYSDPGNGPKHELNSLEEASVSHRNAVLALRAHSEY